MTLDEAIKNTEEVADTNERLSKTIRPAMQLIDYGKCAERHRQLAEWLKELKQLREQTRWIPVSERTPEHPNPNPEFEGKPLDIYLVCKRDNIPFRAFWNGKHFTDGWTSLDVDAWMPLPKPYKVESADRKAGSI